MCVFYFGDSFMVFCGFVYNGVNVGKVLVWLVIIYVYDKDVLLCMLVLVFVC